MALESLTDEMTVQLSEVLDGNKGNVELRFTFFDHISTDHMQLKAKNGISLTPELMDFLEANNDKINYKLN